MEVLAKGRYIKISPKKARPVADLIRGKKAIEARAILSLMPQSSAAEIKKVLESAIANAENNFNLLRSDLEIKKIMIDGGPTVKRYMPRAKGSASEIRRRTSHIEIVLSGQIKTKRKKEEKQVADKEPVIRSEEEKSELKSVKASESLEKRSGNVKGSQGAKVSKFFRRKTG